MILSGSIERFDLASVLQFLAQNGCTGILEIRDYEEHGQIYLVKGHVEAISLPLTDDRLGVFLLKNGLVAEHQLARVLMEEAAGLQAGEARKALGERLVERGFVSEQVIRQSVYRLTMSRMFEIAHWRKGVFSYDEPDHMPDFRISIKGNVQELLLQAQVRIDHGDKPRKRMPGPQQTADQCVGCTVTDCSPAVKAKYLKKETCLWRKMSSPPDRAVEPRTQTRSDTQSLLVEEARAEAAMQGKWGQF